MTRRWILALVAAACAPCALPAADFPQFRGPAGDGAAVAAAPPLEWAEGQNIVWKSKLPGTGWAQPIVVGDTVFVTAAVGEKLGRPKDMETGVKDLRSIPGMVGRAPDVNVSWRLFALDADTGHMRWEKTVTQGKPKFPIHPSNTYATETPCADAGRVYAYFGAIGTLASYDHSGAEVWKVELGAYPYSNGFGSGSSPALFGGKLYVANFNEKKSFLAAFDAATGKELWRQDGFKPGSSWATPFVWRNSKRTELVACSDQAVTAHDPDTGAELWRLGGIDTSFAPSPAADGDRLLLGASSPFSKSPMYAVRAGAAGDVSLKNGDKSNDAVLWHRTGGKVGMASPVAAGGLLYFASDGLLTCYDAVTGKEWYRERLPRSRTVTASLLLAGDKILAIDEAGQATWVKAGPKFEVIGTSEIKDTFWASPAVSGTRLYLRGVDALYCIGQ